LKGVFTVEDINKNVVAEEIVGGVDAIGTFGHSVVLVGIGVALTIGGIACFKLVKPMLEKHCNLAVRREPVEVEIISTSDESDRNNVQ
jgi:hypothetical protein